jgi:iron complex transport system substrate-binding protein
MTQSGTVAERLIMFAPNLVESAWVLGYGDRVVAITDYCVWPPELLDRPRVGGMLDPNLERILGLGPDLLVVQGDSPRLRSFARAQGVRLAEIKMDDDLSSIFGGLARMDSLLGHGTTGRAQAVVSQIRAELEQVRSSVAGLDRPEVLLVLGREPGSLQSLFTTGEGTFLAELLWIAGGRSYLGAQRQGYGNLGLETLVAHPPQVAIEIRPDRSSGDLDELAKPWRRLGLADVRVALLEFDGAMIPGPRVGELARRLRDLLHPNALRATSEVSAP